MIRSNRYSSMEKFLSRQELLIDTFRIAFNKPSIDPDKHIITLCGENHIDGVAHEHAEFPHLINDEFIVSPDQYIGVDNNQSIIDLNKAAIPGIKYIKDNIEDVFPKYDVNPEVVFFDTNRMGSTKELVVEPFCKVLLEVAERYDHQVLVIFNWMGWCYKQSVSPEKSLQSLAQNKDFQQAMKLANWELFPKYYHYRNGNVGMFAFHFLKLPSGMVRRGTPVFNEVNKELYSEGGNSFGGRVIPFDQEVSHIVDGINQSFLAFHTPLTHHNTENEMSNNTNKLILAQVRRVQNELYVLEKQLGALTNESAPASKSSKKVSKVGPTKVAKDTKKVAKSAPIAKDPKWVEAGLKAAKTRRLNKARALKGLPPIKRRKK